jgi:ArsR family transcriptional regulator
MENEILKLKAEMLAALANPVRLKILERLRSGPCCVCKIFPYVGAEQSNVSHHLAILKKAGVVHSEKRGAWIWYEIADRRIFKIVDLVNVCAAARLTKSRGLLKALLKERR